MMDQKPEPRMKPSNVGMERALIGSLLRDNLRIPDAIRVLRDEDFSTDAHQKIYKAIATVSDQGKKATILAVAEFLSRQKYAGQSFLEITGGESYLRHLWDEAPSAGDVAHYADTIRQKSIASHLIDACNEIQGKAYDISHDYDDLLAEAEKKILAIGEIGIAGETITLQQAVQQAYTRLDRRRGLGDDEFNGVPTGFVDLDKILAGFQDSELIILAARPSVGKTALALNIARYAAVDNDLPVLFVSLEQASIELGERLICCQGMIDSHRLRRGIVDAVESTKLINAGDILSRSKMFIDDTPGQNMLRIAANARRLKAKHDIRMVVVDYLQLIDADRRSDNRQEQVASISRRLKFLARELKIPVIALSQLNRGIEAGAKREPRLSDLRESGAIEQDADTVIMIHRVDDTHETSVIEAIVAKQRNGPTGSCKLMYEKKYMRFRNMAVAWQEIA